MSAEQTPDIADTLLPVLMNEYGGEREDWTGMGSLSRVAAALAPVLDAAVREALYAARDDLYAGLGPDLYADADIVYGEWLGNRADRITEPVSHEAATSESEN